jgi:lipopolysaccharide biosynthesis glycosyltransferase
VFGEFDDESKTLVERTLSEFNNGSVSYYPISDEDYQKIRSMKRSDSIPHLINENSADTYIRLMLSDVLSGLDKVLYYDSDIVVLGDITPVWNSEISDYYLAGVPDYNLSFNPDFFHLRHSALKDGTIYINAGLQLLNLKKIREDGMDEKLLQNAFDPRFDDRKFLDQDIVNITFNGHIFELDSVYDYCTGNMLNEEKWPVVMIHFTEHFKPWEKEAPTKEQEPFFEAYKEVLNEFMENVGLSVAI